MRFWAVLSLRQTQLKPQQHHRGGTKFYELVITSGWQLELTCPIAQLLVLNLEV